MQDFPANSQKAKEASEPRQPVKPVTTAETVRRKRGLGHKFKDTFFGGDSRGAVEFVILGIMIPAVKDMMFDALTEGVRYRIYGDSRVRRGASSGYSGLGQATYNNYTSYSTPPTKAQQQAHPSLSRGAQARHDLSGLVIPTRIDAQEVIDQMFEILSRHGSVNVAELYELVDIRPSHTDVKWGWTSLLGAKAVPRRGGGFMLDLPEPVAL